MVINKIKIYINPNGSLNKQIEEPIFRLSNQTNIIQLIAPFSPLNVMRLNFLLANGTTTNPVLIEPTGTQVAVGNEMWNVWEYEIDSATLAICATYKSSPLYVSFSENEIVWQDGVNERTTSDDDFYGMFQTPQRLLNKASTILPLENQWAIVAYTPEVNLSTLQYYIYKYNGSAWVNTQVNATILTNLVKRTELIKLTVQPSTTVPYVEETVTVYDQLAQQIVDIYDAENNNEQAIRALEDKINRGATIGLWEGSQLIGEGNEYDFTVSLNRIKNSTIEVTITNQGISMIYLGGNGTGEITIDNTVISFSSYNTLSVNVGGAGSLENITITNIRLYLTM